MSSAMYKPLNDTDTEEELKNAQGNVRRNLRVKEISNFTSRAWSTKYGAAFRKNSLISAQCLLCQCSHWTISSTDRKLEPRTFINLYSETNYGPKNTWFDVLVDFNSLSFFNLLRFQIHDQTSCRQANKMLMLLSLDVNKIQVFFRSRKTKRNWFDI